MLLAKHDPVQSMFTIVFPVSIRMLLAKHDRTTLRSESSESVSIRMLLAKHDFLLAPATEQNFQFQSACFLRSMKLQELDIIQIVVGFNPHASCEA